MTTEDPAFERLRARLAAQQEELAARLSTQRRQADHSDYLYDKAQDAYWDRIDNRLYVDRAVDASIPQERWRAVVDEGEDVEETAGAEGGAPPPPPRRGRPRTRGPRTRLVKPSEDIRRVENNLFVEGSTWWPGLPQIIDDWMVDGTGPRRQAGARLFNTYRPAPKDEAAADAGPWVEHVRRLFPDVVEHEHFFNVCAHMVQRPEVKCNTAVVMSGSQGIGKDAALFPVKLAIGHWNSRNIDPDELFSPYRPWLETLMLIIDEVRPHSEDFRATTFYNTLKPLIAAPPDTLPLNDKYVKMRHVINVMRVFITTNDWLALFIPENDRRMFIMNSPLPGRWHEAADPQYFDRYWRWLEQEGGAAGVARWLAERDLSAFDPKAAPPRTQTWSEISQSWDDTEHDPVSLVLEEIGWPDALLTSELVAPTSEIGSFDYRSELASIVRSPRKLAHKMAAAGYALVSAPLNRWEFESDGEGGRKRIRSKAAWVKRSLGLDLQAARALVRERGRRLVSGDF